MKSTHVLAFLLSAAFLSVPAFASQKALYCSNATDTDAGFRVSIAPEQTSAVVRVLNVQGAFIAGKLSCERPDRNRYLMDSRQAVLVCNDGNYQVVLTSGDITGTQFARVFVKKRLVSELACKAIHSAAQATESSGN